MTGERRVFTLRPGWLAVLTVLSAAVLRLAFLGRNEPWWDEYLTLYRALLPLPELIRTLAMQSASEVFSDTSPPLHHMLVHFGLSLGRDAFFARLPNALCGVGTVAVLYFLGRECANRRTGLLAALMCALLQSHLILSRDMRWYASFHFLSLASLYCLLRMTRSRSWPARLGFVTASAASLYASYIGGPFLAGQGAFILGRVLWLRASGRPGEARRLFTDYALCALCVILLYLPQLPGQLVTMRTFYTGHGHVLEFAPILEALRSYMAPFQRGPVDFAWITAPLMILGSVVMFRGNKRSGALLFIFWAVFPIAAAYMVDVKAEIKPRYLVGLFFLMIMTVSASMDAAAELASRKLPGVWRENSRTLGGMALIALLCLPNYDYPGFYNGRAPALGAVARFLALDKENAEFLAFDVNRQRKFIFQWLLGDVFEGLGAMPSPPRYQRGFYLTSDKGFVPQGAAHERLFKLSGETADVYRLGLANLAPVPLVPGPDGTFVFRESFEDFSFYQDASGCVNTAPDMQRNALCLYGFGGKGTADYHFADAGAGTLARAVLSANAALRFKQRQLAPTAVLKAYAGPSEDALTLIGTVDFAAFADKIPALRDPDATGDFTAAFSWDAPVAAGQRDLFIRFEFTPGDYQGMIEINDFTLTAGLAGGACATAPDPAGTADPALAMRLGNLSKNVSLAAWREGEYGLGQAPVFLFALPGEPTPAPPGVMVNGPDARERFLRAHPGAVPALRLRDHSGAVRYELYDPALSDPNIPLTPGRPALVENPAPEPFAAKGLRMEGRIHRPVLRLGGQTLSVPLSAPEGSVILLNPGGSSLVRFTPRFTEKAFATTNMIAHDPALRRNPDEDCLSCQTDAPCSFSYLFASDLPFSSFRLLVYPRVNTQGRNAVRVSYAVNDPDARTVLLDYQNHGPQPWAGVMDGLDFTRELPKNTHLLYVRFDLTGDGAQLWSTDSYPMTIEASFDASSLAEPILPPGKTWIEEVSGEDGTLSLWFDRRRLGFFERLFR